MPEVRCIRAEICLNVQNETNESLSVGCPRQAYGEGLFDEMGRNERLTR